MNTNSDKKHKNLAMNGIYICNDFIDFKVEDLKYVKDDPFLDSSYSSFLSVNQQVKPNLRGNNRK